MTVDIKMNISEWTVNDNESIQPQQVKHSTTMIFSVNYDIPDKSWWNPDYTHHVGTVDHLLKQHKEYKCRIKLAYGKLENKEFFHDYVGYHTHRYLLETLIGEGNIDGSTRMEELEKYVDHPDDTKICHKINNLKKAMDRLFSDGFDFVNLQTKKIDVDSFTPEFIQKVHVEVTDKLVKTPGVYRTKWAAPNYEDWFYLNPIKISDNIQKLCMYVRHEIKNEDSNKMTPDDIFVARVKMVSTFLSHFLHIHPFTNGNGRVARLMVSWLIADLTVVPVALFTSLTPRDTYLHCLRESRLTTSFLPTNLARLILESVVYAIRMVCVSLDI